MVKIERKIIGAKATLVEDVGDLNGNGVRVDHRRTKRDKPRYLKHWDWRLH